MYLYGLVIIFVMIRQYHEYLESTIFLLVATLTDPENTRGARFFTIDHTHYHTYIPFVSK